jgi:hypothetical protein
MRSSGRTRATRDERCARGHLRRAAFDEPPVLREDDDRRAQTLYDLLKSLPGSVPATTSASLPPGG